MLLDNYLDLPYTTVLKKDGDGIFVASVKELKGCVAHGDTEIEALNALASMKRLWLESCIADGTAVPLPESEEELPSGKWLQRVPRSIHAALVEAAEHEGVSLNQLVVSILSREIGHREGVVQDLHASPDIADPWSALVDDSQMNWIVKGVPSTSETKYLEVLLRDRAQTDISVKSGIKTHGNDKKTHSGWN